MTKNKPLTISEIEKELVKSLRLKKNPYHGGNLKCRYYGHPYLNIDPAVKVIESIHRQKIEELVEGLQKELYKKGFAANYLKNKMKGKEIVGYRRVRVFEIEESDLLKILKILKGGEKSEKDN